MSRPNRRLKRAAKRKAKAAELRSLVAQVDSLVQPLGCHISGIDPSAVEVQKDARTYRIAVLIRFPTDASIEQATEVSTLITNRISRVTRVLRDL